MTRTDTLERGRAAFTAEAWGEAHDHLAAADLDTPLDPADLERLGIAAWLTGRGAASLEYLERLHQAWLAAGETDRAARSAVWLAVRFGFQGEAARSGGWVARAQRLVDGLGGGGDTVERGYLLFPQA